MQMEKRVVLAPVKAAGTTTSMEKGAEDMAKEAITLVGVGDVIIDREQPETMFRHVADVFRSADIAYANMEQVLSDKGTPHPRQAVYSSPKIVNAYLSAGIDVVSLATNHIGDWGIEGILGTLETLKAAGIPYCGAGLNLAEARKPAILERKGTRVGFLNYCTVHMDEYAATDDRPGLAPIGVWTVYERVDYQPATPPLIVSITHKEDLTYLVEAVRNLKAQVDIVVLCMHWGQHLLPRIIPDYCFEIGHAAIDAGADIILGSHTHILKGIEMYKGKPIFYSLANFALELGPHMRDRKHVGLLDKLYRVKDWHDRRKTMIAKAIIEKGKIARVSYIPCYENDDKEPEIVKRSDPRGQDVFNYVEDISKSEGLAVHFEWDGDEVVVLP
jgi:poly-gamma-glutamate capsule biosynthesis protein CapA/YwtB (metallophosphatase superfamily)